MQRISPFLWFDDQAEQAAEFYVSLFEDSKVTEVRRYPEGSRDRVGEVMTVSFELAGQTFTAMNGGPHFQLTPAVSFFVPCEDQAEVDRLWGALSEGGQDQMCGWVTDRFGVTWQIVPNRLGKLLGSDDAAVRERVTTAMLQMQKLDVAVLEAAATG